MNVSSISEHTLEGFSSLRNILQFGWIAYRHGHHPRGCLDRRMYQSTIRNPRRTSKGKIVPDHDCHHQHVHHYARPQSKLKIPRCLFQILLETVKILLFIELFLENGK